MALRADLAEKMGRRVRATSSTLIDKNELESLVNSLANTNERITAEDALRAVYNTGFRAALAAIAEAYDLNAYAVRRHEAAYQQMARIPTKYDMRL